MIYGADHEVGADRPRWPGRRWRHRRPTCCRRPSRRRGPEVRPVRARRCNKGGNVAKAKEELKACGKPNGFKTTIAVRNNKPVEVATAQSIQASLKKVGINVEIDQYDGSQTSGIVGSPENVKKKGYGMIIMGWGPDFPTVQGFGRPAVGRLVHPGERQQQLRPDRRQDHQRSLRRRVTTLDDSGKTQIATEINKKVMEGGYYLPFVFQKFINWRSSRPDERLHVATATAACTTSSPRPESPRPDNRHTRRTARKAGEGRRGVRGPPDDLRWPAVRRGPRAVLAYLIRRSVRRRSDAGGHRHGGLLHLLPGPRSGRAPTIGHQLRRQAGRPRRRRGGTAEAGAGRADLRPVLGVLQGHLRRAGTTRAAATSRTARHPASATPSGASRPSGRC